jgi:2-keto-4-pentenoate hydratase
LKRQKNEEESMSSASAKQAAMLLSRARKSGEPLAAFPEALVPQDRAAAYAIQDEVIALEGDVGGWKIAAGTEPEPLCSPILSSLFLPTGATLDIAASMATVAEVEVAVRLGRDLAARDGFYSRDEVIAAIEGLLPALEIIGTRFAPGVDVPRLLAVGDLQVNAAVVCGNLVTDWQGLDLANLKAGLTIGAESFEVETGASFDATIDALLWLANEGSIRQGGLRAGQIIITGSRLNKPLGQKGEIVSGTLAGLGTVSVTLS